MTKTITETDRDAMLDMARTLVDAGGVSVLFVGNPDEDGKNAVIPLDLLDNLPDHPTDRLRIVLMSYKEAGLPRPPWLCFASDSYQQVSHREDDADPFEPMADDPTWHGRGTLQERFEAGHPDVTEAVVLSMMTEDGVLSMGIAPYVRAQGALGQDVLVFGDLRVDEPDQMIDGDVPDAMREFFA